MNEPETRVTPETPEIAVQLQQVDKVFHSGDGRVVEALRALDLSVYRGELVAIVGQTGCGKSTAFNLLLGLFPPTAGTVTVAGSDPHRDFEALKRHIAVVFQDGRLLPWRTARDNVSLGLEYCGVAKAERNRIAVEWLARLGLEGRENAYPYELSGGMRQRVAIARCFALDPEIILCDESFSALDELTADRLRGEFVRLVKDGGKTGVFITHSIEEALTVGDRVLVFAAPGHVAAEFTRPEELTDSELWRLRTEIRQIMADAPIPDPADR